MGTPKHGIIYLKCVVATVEALLLVVEKALIHPVRQDI
jgi:hypothetical protein